MYTPNLPAYDSCFIYRLWKNWICVLTFLLFIGFGANVFAATYYVDISGNDVNPGTEASPWKSLNKAAQAVQSNDTVIIKNGEYSVTETISLDHKDGVTFKAYSGHSPTIKFVGTSSNAFGIGVNINNLVVEGLTFVWATDSNGNIIGIGGKNVTIKNCHIYFDNSYSPQKYDCVKILSTASYITIEGCEIHGAPNQGIDTVGGDYLTIRNNTIYDCQNAIVLKGGSDNNLIENNKCYNFVYGAIGMGGYTSATFINYDFECTNSVVKRNIVYYDDEHNNNIGGGIFLWGAKGCKVYNNTIYGAGIHLKTGGDPTNLSFFCMNNEISNNIIWRTGNDGLFVVDAGNDTGLILKNNLYWKTTGSGEFKVNGIWYNYDQFKSTFSFDSNSINSDPLLTDPSSKSFSLSAGSPAIDKGIEIPGEPFSQSKPDIGGIEYPPSAPTNLRMATSE